MQSNNYLYICLVSSVTLEYDNTFMKKLETITNKKLDDSTILWESL